MLKHGVPSLIFVDNGSIYSSHHFARICARLKTELRHTRPGRPQGRGKQENFFRFVDLSFVPEAYDLIEQGKIQTLDDLNRFFTAWLDVAYHQKIHNTFKQRPLDRYQKCEHPIRSIPPHELAEIFLLEESRKVDKTNCVSLLGTVYELETGFAGQEVQLRFDAFDMSVVQVWKDGKRQGEAQLLKKRPMDRKKPTEPPVVHPPLKTGLNYVELAYEKYMIQQKEKQGLLNLLEQELPHD